MKRGSDILIAEIDNIDNYSPELLNKILTQIRIFSLVGQITLNDRYILTFPGITPNHFLKELIQQVFDDNEIR